jgi:hypothetical protein
MAVETPDDRSYLLADFGVSVTYTPVGGSASTLTGIIDNAYEQVDPGGSVSFAMTRPRLTCRTADLPNISEGATMVIDSVNYVVRVHMPDGTGFSELMLEAQ